MVSTLLPAFSCAPGSCTNDDTTEGNASCALGHWGPLCGMCNATPTENGAFYAWGGRGCVECQEVARGRVWAAVLASGVVPLFLALTVWRPLLKCGNLLTSLSDKALGTFEG